MFNQIRKVISKMKGEDVFCSIKEEEYILSVLASEENINPFEFKETDEKGIELLEFIINITEVILKNFNKNISKGKRNKFLFFFVDDMDINAFATNIKNVDVVGVNIGILTTLYDFYKTVIDNKLFPEIGFDVEKKKDLIFNLQFFSIIYIILHEMGHLYDGHVGFRNSNMLKEIRHLNSREEVLFNKTIEMDADAFAMNRSLELIENLISIRNNKTNINYDIVNYSYKTMMFAIYSFYLFIEETLNNTIVSRDTYFSPAIRQIYNMDITENFVKRERKDFISEIQQINEWIFSNADFTLDKYYSREKKGKEKQEHLLDKLMYLQSREVKEEMEAVKIEWNKIRDELQKNARFILAPKYNNLL